MTAPAFPVFGGAILFATWCTVSAAQSADDAWRDMYPHLECIALSEKAPQDLAERPDMHLRAVLQILANTPDVFSPRSDDFVPNGSDADAFGRPTDGGADAKVHLGRILQVIALRTRMRVQGPDPVYPEGMNVSPSSQNLIMEQKGYAAEYRRQGCQGLLNG